MHAGRVKIESHSSCRASAILKYFCPLGKFQILRKIRKQQLTLVYAKICCMMLKEKKNLHGQRYSLNRKPMENYNKPVVVCLKHIMENSIVQTRVLLLSVE